MSKKGIPAGNLLKDASNRYWKSLYFWLIPILLVAVVAGVYWGCVKKADVQEIQNGTDFVNALKYNTLYKNTDTYTLKDDIVLGGSEESAQSNINELFRIDGSVGSAASTRGACFYGTLDGSYSENGGELKRRKLTINLSEDTEPRPLFDRIEEGAVIKNIDIVFNGTFSVKKGVDAAALLVRVNKGTIENVSVSNGLIDTAEAVQGDESTDSKAIGGMIAYNYGKIIGCNTQVTFMVSDIFCHEPGEIERVWNCYVGAIAALNFNEDTVQDTVATVEMTVQVPSAAKSNNFTVLARSPYNRKGDRNNKFGYAFGYNRQKLNITLSGSNNVNSDVYKRNAADAELWK